jgi:3-hydroxyacyl-CoA dehydrogenase
MAHTIRRVAVLGAGVMGTGIATHLANAGVESLLFDITPEGAEDPRVLARKGIAAALKSKPPALFAPERAGLVKPCCFDLDAELLASCDWIVEVVVERLDIKEKVFKWVADNRRPGSIVSSNTSGISLAAMAETMPEEMRRHFLVTHFFNPVRYMRLLELVTGPDTDPEVTASIAAFGERALGKGIVYAKDTPNFIANRIGTYGMGAAMRAMADSDLTIEAVDAIFGPAMGRPSSAVFKTGDIVGIDTLVHVFRNVYDNAPEDPERDVFQLPEWVHTLVASGGLGRKSGGGFYKRTKGPDGRKVDLTLDTATGEYRPKDKPRFGSLGKARGEDDPRRAVATVVYADDIAAQVAWRCTADTLIYAAANIPGIADDVVNVDRAMRWGFGWDIGPFETWDAIGVERSVARMKEEGRAIPAWVEAMLAAGRTSFYARDDAGRMTAWGIDGQAHPVPGSPGRVMVADLKAGGAAVVYRNGSSTLVDMGDGALLLEFHSKMNALDELIFENLEKGLDMLDEGKFEAMVIGNQGGKAFCAGANVLMILMHAMQQNWSAIDEGLVRLQAALQRAKYSTRPVVTAPYSLTLGGGAEVAMHSSATRAGGELYMGLVEVGVGLIPGGGGCKEVVMRYCGDLPQDANYDSTPLVQKAFERIGLAKVTSSVEEARAWGYLRKTDSVTMDIDALLGDAKALALGLAASGYQPPPKRTAKLPGPGGRSAIELFLHQMHDGGYATEHDVTVGKKLAWVLTGGDIPAGTVVTEDRMLELEREAFLSLCGDAKSVARMQHFLQKGKPLRN